MDLLLLKMVYHVNLAKTAKLCLKAFVDHENIVFLPCESPNPEIKYVYKKSQTKQAVRLLLRVLPAVPIRTVRGMHGKPCSS